MKKILSVIAYLGMILLVCFLLMRPANVLTPPVSHETGFSRPILEQFFETETPVRFVRIRLEARSGKEPLPVNVFVDGRCVAKECAQKVVFAEMGSVISVEREGYDLTPSETVVTKHTELEIVGRFSVRGKVTDANGIGLFGATVSCDDREVKTAFDGSFTLGGVEKGATVTTELDGFTFFPLLADFEKDLIFVAERKGYGATFRLTFADGTPVTDAKVALIGEETLLLDGSSDGVYSVEQLVGEYCVSIEREGYDFYRFDAATLRDEKFPISIIGETDVSVRAFHVGGRELRFFDGDGDPLSGVEAYVVGKGRMKAHKNALFLDFAVADNVYFFCEGFAIPSQQVLGGEEPLCITASEGVLTRAKVAGEGILVLTGGRSYLGKSENGETLFWLPSGAEGLLYSLDNAFEPVFIRAGETVELS